MGIYLNILVRFNTSIMGLNVTLLKLRVEAVLNMESGHMGLRPRICNNSLSILGGKK